jgi:hypothetical protein
VGRGQTQAAGTGSRAEEVAALTSAFPFTTVRPRHPPTLHPQVGEARETTEEFDRELFWRRLSECLSCRVPLSSPIPASLSLSLRLSPVTAPFSPHPLCELVHFATLIDFGAVFETPGPIRVEKDS